MRRWMRRGSAGVAALALAALTAGLLAACGNAGDPAQTVRLSPEPRGATSVAVRVGDTVVLSLEANPTTGYEWTFTGGDTFTIVKNEYVADPNPGGLVGAGGTQVVTLEVTEAGESALTGTYARSWETPDPDARPDLTVTVTSTD